MIAKSSKSGLQKMNWYNSSMQRIILDIGANSGTFSEYMLSMFDDVKVIAFEPNLRFESDFKTLSKFYESRFEYELKAVSASTGKREFYLAVDPSQQLSSFHRPNPIGLWDNYTKTFNIKEFMATKVSTCNGKYIRDKYGRKIFMVKIDVQGSDVSVARNLLSYLDINFLVIEFQASSLPEESVYIGQKNSLVELSKLIVDFGLSSIKLFPNSSTSVEYNVVLCKKNALDRYELKFIELLMQSSILSRFSEILPIGDIPYPRLVRKLHRILNSFLVRWHFNGIKL